MPNAPYWLKQPYPSDYGCRAAFFPRRKQGWPGLKKILNVTGLATFLFFMACLLSTMLSYAQGPCPTSNCTSGDMQITKVELVDANTLGSLPNSCPASQQNISIKLKVSLDVTSNTRYGFLIVGDVYINGTFSQKVWQCYGEDFSQGPHVKILDQVISWPCGSTIELRNVYTAWGNQAPSTAICGYLNADGSISNCAAIDPKCRYYGTTESFTVAAPLIADFTYTGSCPGNTLFQPVTFSSPSSGTGATSGGNPPYQYSWEIRDAVTNAVLATSTSNPYTYTPGSANNLTVTLTVTDASVPQGTDTVVKTVTVTSCCAPPSVSSQPASQTKCQGSSASFTVGYTGGSPTPVIQWQINTDGVNWNNLTNVSPYSNVTGTTLNISGVTTAMNGYQYRAVLQSGVCTSVSSNAATLNVSPSTVGGTVGSAQTICSGSQPSALSLSGNTGNVVKWQRSTDNFVSNVTDIANTTSSLSSSTIGSLIQDTWFRAVVQSGVCDAANSSAVKISVNPASVGGSVASAQTICTGSQPASGLTLSGQTGTVVKWQKSNDNFVSNTTDIAVTTTTLGAGTMGALTQDTWFRAVVQSGVCNAVNSTAVKITVSPATVGGTVGSAQTICSGSQPLNDLTLSGQTGSVVKWQKSTDDFVSNVSDIANTSTNLTAASIGALTQNTWFRAVISSGACTASYSGSVKITVQQPVSNNTIASSQTICSGQAPASLTGSTPSGGSGSYLYQWQSRTTGSFMDISGANSKDYAPGALIQNTEFRRVVTGGTACPANTSTSVTVSISPESVVYNLVGSNFCASTPNSGTIQLSGSYPGVSYQLLKQSDNSAVQSPQTGNGSPLIWSGLEAGTYYVTGTGIAPTYCTSQTAPANVLMFDCSVFYTLTQGYYGGKNGKSCIGSTPVSTISYLLGTTDMVVGSAKLVTIPATSAGASKLNATLPGGGTPAGLPNGNCNITTGCFSFPVYLTKQGKINNVLLSQTITLSLNTRWNQGELLLFPIRSGYLTTQKMTGCTTGATLINDCSSGGTVSSIQMNQHVVDYLGTNATVADLLNLANGILGGTILVTNPGVPSYSDVASAVDCINQSFDEGRRFLDYYPAQVSCEMLFPTVQTTLVSARSASVEAQPVSSVALSVNAYPNPYSDQVNFMVESRYAGHGSLEVYNMLGQKVKTVYQGYIAAGKQNFVLSLSAHQRSALIYILTVGERRITGKVLQIDHK